MVADVLEATFYEITQLIKLFSKRGSSYFNICLTDGKRLIASRYCSSKKIVPESMHYSLGSRFVAREGYHMLQEEGRHDCVLITSEKLTNFEAEWHDVPANHLLLIDEGLTLQLRRL